MILSVTDLTSYLFCPRKLYARKVLGIIEPTNKAMVLGTIRHETHDILGKKQEVLVRQIGKDTGKQEALSMFKTQYLKALKGAILRHKKTLEDVDLIPGDVFVDVWPHILTEAGESSKEVVAFAEEHGVFGEELWDRYEPKIISEYHITSEKLQLKGIIDRIDKINGGYIPFELKTGRPPREGVWPGHKVQVGAYELMMEEAFNMPVREGYVRYLDQRLNRPVMMNPFLEDEIKKLVGTVQDLISGNAMPDPCGKKICNCAQIEESAAAT